MELRVGVNEVGNFSGNQWPVIISLELLEILCIEMEKYGGHFPWSFVTINWIYWAESAGIHKFNMKKIMYAFIVCFSFLNLMF